MDGPSRDPEGGGQQRVEDVVISAGRAGAVDGRHPQVGRARVKDDLELLWGRPNSDGANVG